MSADVIVGRGQDGHLFLTGGSQSVLEYVSGMRAIPPERQVVFADNLATRRALCRQRGCQYLHIVCPDKHSVLFDKAPFEIKVAVGKVFHKYVDGSFCYPVDQLRCTRSGSYWKTDSHWNLDGQIVFAREVLSSFDAEAGDLEILDRLYADGVPNLNFCGDLGSKLTPPEVEEGLVYRRPKHAIFLSNKVAGSNGTVQIYLNKHARKRKLLIFGDSFAMHCLPILTNFYSEILMIRSPYFHRDILELFAPTYVLTENVERYLPSTPSDKQAPLGTLLPRVLGKTDTPDENFYVVFNALLQPGSSNYIAVKRRYLE